MTTSKKLLEKMDEQNELIEGLAKTIGAMTEILAEGNELQRKLVLTLTRYFTLEVKRAEADEAKQKELPPPTKYDDSF